MYIEDLMMKPVENGIKVSYVEREKGEHDGSFEPMRYNPKEFVFGDKDNKKAFAKFLELSKQLKKK